MVIKCRICGKDDFNSEGGLSCHITKMHSGSAHGKGSRPSSCTNGKRDDGARPKTHTPHHKEPERHNSDRDVVKGVARMQRDSLQRGSPDEFPLKVNMLFIYVLLLKRCAMITNSFELIKKNHRWSVVGITLLFA